MKQETARRCVKLFISQRHNSRALCDCNRLSSDRRVLQRSCCNEDDCAPFSLRGEEDKIFKKQKIDLIRVEISKRNFNPHPSSMFSFLCSLALSSLIRIASNSQISFLFAPSLRLLRDTNQKRRKRKYFE